MAFVSKNKLSRDTRWKMLQESGYRERNIFLDANSAVRGNKGRTISFYKKHRTYGDKNDHRKYDVATFDLKRNKWV